jgi:hypothetical protein
MVFARFTLFVAMSGITIALKPNRIIVMRYVLSIALLVLAFSDGSLSQPTPQEATGAGRAVAANITPEEAKERARKAARLDALSQLGVSIQSEAFQFKGETSRGVFDDFVQLNRSSVHAKIIEERILKLDKGFSEDGLPFYQITMRVKAILETGLPDPTFLVKLHLNQEIYRAGDAMFITVKPTKDCYLYLFNLITADTLVMLFPNKLFPNNFIGADSVFVFPPKDYWHMMELETELPKDQDETAELIMVIAIRQNVPFLEGELDNTQGFAYIPTRRSAFLQLNRWLVQMPLSERTQTSQLYRIVR